jgi:hypothetical protein
MVSTNKSTERAFPKEAVTPHVIKQYRREHRTELGKPNAYLGGWHDPNTNHVYLDVATHYKSFEDAKDAGRKAKQLAVYDVAHGKSIYLQESSLVTSPRRMFWSSRSSDEQIYEELAASGNRPGK